MAITKNDPMEDHNQYPKPTGSNLLDFINLLLYEKKRQERNEPLIINGKVLPKLGLHQAYTDHGTVVNL